MSDTVESQKPPRNKGKGLLIKAMLALVLIGAGGGGVFAMVRAGMFDEQGQTTKQDNAPRLIRKGEEDPFAPKGEGKEDEGNGLAIDGEGGSAYRTSYYNFADDFTANLRNSTALVQISLACSTRRDGRVLIWLKKHELAIRSEVLVVLADTPEEDAFTPEGKQRMQQRLTAAINRVLTQTEGFGGVDAVYFKSFLVQ
jgi:flagellar FliL protein